MKTAIYLFIADLICFFPLRILFVPYALTAELNLLLLSPFTLTFGEQALYTSSGLEITIQPLGWVIILVEFLVLGFFIELVRGRKNQV